MLTFFLHILCLDDESSGLYGFLNVIVHSATGFQQSSSKWVHIVPLTVPLHSEYSRFFNWACFFYIIVFDSDRFVLYTGSGFFRIFCKQGKNTSLSQHNWPELEWGGDDFAHHNSPVF